MWVQALTGGAQLIVLGTVVSRIWVELLSHHWVVMGRLLGVHRAQEGWPLYYSVVWDSQALFRKGMRSCTR